VKEKSEYRLKDLGAFKYYERSGKSLKCNSR